MPVITQPVPFFADIDGSPLDNGRVYFGTAGGNPVTSPVTVYWDDAQTQPVAQPAQTMNGVIYRSGTPAAVYASTALSMLVQNSAGAQVLYAASVPSIDGTLRADLAASSGSSLVGFLQSGTGAVATTLQARGRRAVLSSDFGTVGDGVANDSAAMALALATGRTVFVPEGTYLLDNLTMSTNAQQLIALGNVRFVKRANGPILTVSGNDCVLTGIQFRGESSTPAFTGDNISITGANCVLDKCGSRWAFGRAVRCTGERLRIYGTSDIYQTADATATGFDIDIGNSGTATLYHIVDGIQSTQSTGGLRFIDVGGIKVTNSQFGKLTITSSNIPSPPSGVGSNAVQGNRINNNVVVEISNTTFSNNAQGAGSITFAANTSGHNYDESNVLSVGVTLTDNSVNSNIVDSRLIYLQTYTTTWTASSVNPTLGNGTLTAYYSRRGKTVRVSISLTIGSTTALGTGFWQFTLPAIPNSAIAQTGSGRALISGSQYVLTPQTQTGGSNILLITSQPAGNDVGAAVPAAWATGSVMNISIDYQTD